MYYRILSPRSLLLPLAATVRGEREGGEERELGHTLLTSELTPSTAARREKRLGEQECVEGGRLFLRDPAVTCLTAVAMWTNLVAAGVQVSNLTCQHTHPHSLRSQDPLHSPIHIGRVDSTSPPLTNILPSFPPVTFFTSSHLLYPSFFKSIFSVPLTWKLESSLATFLLNSSFSKKKKILVQEN